jgi:hypothetical protein
MKTANWLSGFSAAMLLIGLPAAAGVAGETLQSPQTPAGQRQAAPLTVSGPPVCGTRPFCTETSSFGLVVSDFQAILQNTNAKTLTVRLSFKNKLNRPLILGYVSGSGIATDDRGNRYVPQGERAIQGIGLVQGNSADAKFILQPGESSAARFEFVWHSSGQEIFGVSFQLDLAIREVDLIAGNQLRLGREHALHFSGLANRADSPAPPAPRAPTVLAQPAVPDGPAAPAAPPQVDACAGRPRCYSAGPFAAEITGLTPSTLAAYNPPLDMLQARVRFRNLTNQPVILAYVDKSAVISDNYGGRYTVTSAAYGDGAKGIGIVQPDKADSQFVLGPGASGDAAFTLSRRRGRNDPVGATFSFDLTIAQLEVLPSRQIRTIREYSLGFAGLSAAVGGTTDATPPAVNRGVAPPGDACAGKPRCYAEGPFVAEMTGMTSSSILNYRPNIHLLQTKVQFRNLTNQPIILAYVDKSALITDNYGGRYMISHVAYGDGVKGIGMVKDNQADPQFVLAASASGNATFTLSRSRKADNSDPMGSTFNLDLTIAHLEILASQQIRTVREYAVSMANLTASGGSLLNRILQGVPKKD